MVKESDMSSSFRIKTFHGLQDGFEDPADFIEDIETLVERDYFREESVLRIAIRKATPEERQSYDEEIKFLEEKKNRDCRVLFRQNVSGRAEKWYKYRSREVRQDWTKLKARCLECYQIPEEDPATAIRRMEAKYDTIKQGKDESITAFLERADDFQAQYGSQKPNFGIKVIRGLHETGKRESLIFCLRQKNRMDYAYARELIIKSYSGVENLSTFH
ncbi:uncharacterized protein PGRI_011360 [Penicillium griseofulvum]|uniref:Retrotransposon gag domain-containing protein n=1 Tax=Penicillium patulum TaxID=5078 RepID=A0A135LE71_PENPA|nr:uncharacterized protein PGRI_011360 [Penicillium griseofulvum]KXG47266.1 hypothetical protein PGRI_011360 [Penicillium griseofulvum]